MRARIELQGPVLKAPELRVMPNGTDVLRLAVDCGENGQRLPLELVLAGGTAREFAGLRVGQEVSAKGYLRAIGQPLAATSVRRQFEVVVTDLATGVREPDRAQGVDGEPQVRAQVKV